MATQHIVHSFDTELRFLAAKIIEMSERGENMIRLSLKAVIDNDLALAAQIIADDAHLDRLEREVDDKAIAIIAKRQPMAVDLREIIGAIRISGDLERIGDMGKNIAKRVAAMKETHQNTHFYRQMQCLADLALVQLAQSREAYVNRSLALIEAVLKRDEEIDSVYTDLFRHLVEAMAQDRDKITLCAHLLFCAKNIERVGDHATNIVEMLYYMITGRHPSLERVREDLTHQICNN